MSTTTTEPRIYVACLASYNAGRLVGEWIDAGDADSMREDVAAMLAASPIPNAEEFAIHDHEGFGPVELGEYESLEKVAELAAGINEHGEAFAAFAANEGLEYLDAERFEDAYCGEYGSLADYAANLAEELGQLEEIPEMFRYRIDWDGIGHDLDCEGYWTAAAGLGAVHVFRPV